MKDLMHMRILKRKDGFTLVELLVVLVILAILAAAVIPSMMGFIDRAREEKYTLQCRNCVLAADVLINERYGRSERSLLPEAADVQTLADVPGTVSAMALGDTASGHEELVHLTYTEGDVSVTYCAHPDACALHDRTYNLGKGSASGDEPSGDESSNTPTDGSVTVTDTSGNTHIININSSWADIRTNLTRPGNANTTIASGIVLSDDSGTYLVASTNTYFSRDALRADMSLADLASAYSGQVKKLEATAKIWTSADIVNITQWEKGFASQPQQFDLAYSNGKYYVAVQAVDVRGTNFASDARWVEITQ